jgi:hypothetical protein
VESGGEVMAGVGVDDGGEDEIDVGVEVNAGGGAVFVSGLRAAICTGGGVCTSWGVNIGFRVGVFKFVRSSRGVQVRAFCEFLVSIL